MKLLIFGLIALLCSAGSQELISDAATRPSVQVPATRPVTQAAAAGLRYRLVDGHESWDPEIKRRVVEAMDAAVAVYNAHGSFDRELTVNYHPGVPTAEANYDGRITFGKQIGRRTALHEIGHTMGVGTTRQWRANLKEGVWQGKTATSLVQAFDGPAAVLKGDRMHFWPYGLNFENETSPVNEIRHVKLVIALRRDMALNDGFEKPQ